MENTELTDEFVKTQLEYLKFYEEKRNRDKETELFLKTFKEEPPKPATLYNTHNNSADDDYLLALKLMQEEESQAEKARKAKAEADDAAFAKLLMEQEQYQAPPKPKPQPPPTVLSDAEYAAQLYAQETRQNYSNNNVSADAQIARLMQEKQELEERLRQAENTSKETLIDVSGVDFPDYWNVMNSPFQSFDVARGTNEWERIERHFSQGLANTPIYRIERIQNKQIWLWFNLKKKELDAKNDSVGANEKYAFHGSRANAYDVILKEGFDHRVANMSGAYGAGVYFAHNSATSNGYVANTHFGKRKMLYCRVLIGDIGPGKNGLRRPPEKKTFFGKTVLYDSVGTNNGVYVVFDNHQCYPEYVIHY
jgi:hypothetical protein